MLTIVHGKMLAKKMTESLLSARKQFKSRPGLGIICILGDVPSEKYVAMKERAAKDLDIYVEKVLLNNNSTTEDVIKAISVMDKNESIDGILVQLPLPSNIKREDVLSSIPPLKDADVLSSDARAAFAHEEFLVLPPIVTAMQYILEDNNISLLLKEVLVLGHGMLVGAPLAQFARQCGAKVTVIDSPVRDLNQFTKDADVIICGTGNPDLLRPEHVKEGVVVIDAGMKVVDGKLRGDAHPDVAIHSSLFTPTPGGVGPLVVSSLMKNVLLLAKAHGK